MSRAHRPILTPWRRWLLAEIAARPGVTARQLARTARHRDRRIRVLVVYDRVRDAVAAGLLEQREKPNDRRRRGLYLTTIGDELVVEVDRSRPIPVPVILGADTARESLTASRSERPSARHSSRATAAR